MKPPTNILNYGAGVNSTACLLLVMTDDRFAAYREGIRIVFADTGGEWPETYHYMGRVFGPYIWKRWHLEIERVAPKVRGFGTLEEQSFGERMVPSRVMRWCTENWKVRPIRAWMQSEDLFPVRQMLGFDAGEVHRTRDSDHPLIEQCYPLVDAGLDRRACERLIEEHGLPSPGKSGCYYCPFQRKGQWITLARTHKDLFDRACQMEENGANFSKGFHLYQDKPLRKWVPGHLAQLNLFDGAEPEPWIGSCMGPCEVET